MNPISLDELTYCLTTGKPISRKSVIITFDDDYEDLYTNAYPMLRVFNIPATVFLATGHIGTWEVFWWQRVGDIIRATNARSLDLLVFEKLMGNNSVSSRHIALNNESCKAEAWLVITGLFKGFPNEVIASAVELLAEELNVDQRDVQPMRALNWAQVREMSENGIDIGAHTVTHPDLTQLKLEEAEREIWQSKKMIEGTLGKTVKHFAYPYGLTGFYNKQIEAIVKKNGFQSICTSEYGAVTPESDVFSLKRVSMPNAFLPESVWKISRSIRRRSRSAIMPDESENGRGIYRTGL